MGGDSEPDGFRGFGRVHLEAGMPLAGDGDLVLFVADANTTSTPELTRQEYNFDVDADAGLDLRVTLSWIDPPASTFSAVQLVHDLDLAVISPTGARHTMWDSGVTDRANVNERVIVDASDVETGTWSVWVWAKQLTTDEQSYSLVVNGAISPATGDGAAEGSFDDDYFDLGDIYGAADDDPSPAVAAAAPAGLMTLCVSMLLGVMAAAVCAT